MTPLSTSPHWHALGSATRMPGTANRSSASKSAYSSRSFRADWEMKPRPRHSKWGRSSNTSWRMARARGLPSSDTARVYWFSTSQRPSSICLSSISMDWRMSRGSKPAVTSGRPYCVGHEPVGPVADDGRHVAWAEEPVEAQVGGLEDGLEGRDDRDVVAEHGEVLDVRWRALSTRDRGGGGGGLEPDGEEDDFLVGVGLGDAQGVERASRPSARRRPGPWPRAGSRCRRAPASCRRRR